jgi:OPT oligopeptide transporter protein
MIQAITNIQIGLNVFTGKSGLALVGHISLNARLEFIISYMLPGRPLAMMSFKTYGYIAMYQG